MLCYATKETEGKPLAVVALIFKDEMGKMHTFTQRQLLENSTAIDAAKSSGIPLTYNDLTGYPHVTVERTYANTADITPIVKLIPQLVEALQNQDLQNPTLAKVMEIISKTLPSDISAAEILKDILDYRKLKSDLTSYSIYIATSETAQFTEKHIINAFNSNSSVKPKQQSVIMTRFNRMENPEDKVSFEVPSYNTLDQAVYDTIQYDDILMREIPGKGLERAISLPNLPKAMSWFTPLNKAYAKLKKTYDYPVESIVGWKNSILALDLKHINPKNITGSDDNNELPIQDNEMEYYKALINLAAEEVSAITGISKEDALTQIEEGNDLASMADSRFQLYMKSLIQLAVRHNWAHTGLVRHMGRIEVQYKTYLKEELRTKGKIDDNSIMDLDSLTPKDDSDDSEDTTVATAPTVVNTVTVGVDGKLARAYPQVVRGASDPAFTLMQMNLTDQIGSYLKGKGRKYWVIAYIKLLRWGSRKPAKLYVEGVERNGQPLYFNLENATQSTFNNDFSTMEVIRIDDKSDKMITDIVVAFGNVKDSILTQSLVEEGLNDLTKVNTLVGFRIEKDYGEVKQVTYVDVTSFQEYIESLPEGEGVDGVYIDEDGDIIFESYVEDDLATEGNYITLNTAVAEMLKNPHNTNSYATPIELSDIIADMQVGNDHTANLFYIWDAYLNQYGIMAKVNKSGFNSSMELDQLIKEGSFHDKADGLIAKGVNMYGTLLAEMGTGQIAYEQVREYYKYNKKVKDTLAKHIHLTQLLRGKPQEPVEKLTLDSFKTKEKYTLTQTILVKDAEGNTKLFLVQTNTGGFKVYDSTDVANSGEVRGTATPQQLGQIATTAPTRVEFISPEAIETLEDLANVVITR